MLRTITPNELFELGSSNRGWAVDLIDVRTPDEYRGGHARGARLIPLAQLTADEVRAQRQSPSEDPIYVICQTGGRSRAGCEILMHQGLTNVVNVEGGTVAWVQAGLPTERSDASAGQAAVSSRGWVRVLGLLGVLASLLLGWLVHPAFTFAAAGIWIGLVVVRGGACPLGNCSVRRPQS